MNPESMGTYLDSLSSFNQVHMVGCVLAGVHQLFHALYRKQLGGPPGCHGVLDSGGDLPETSLVPIFLVLPCVLRWELVS